MSGSPDAAAPSSAGEVLEVESVAVGGDGVARQASGRVVFVPRTAPGDRVRVRITEEHGSYARGRADEVVRDGPDRVEAPCPHYSACGGCQLQHLSYEAQLEAKRSAVADTLERIGGRAVDVPPVAGADRRLGYRNRVTLTLRRGEEGLRAGYHRWDAPGRLVDVERCPLAEPAVDGAWRQLREAWGPAAERLPAGSELRITIRASARGEASLLVEQRELPVRGRNGTGGASPSPTGEPEAIAAAVERLSGYFWSPRGGQRRLLAGESRMEERWLGFDLRLGPETFLQVNRDMTERMEAWLDRAVGERAGGPAGLRILDLYAGVGARALRWSMEGAEAAACEIEAGAVRAGRDAAARIGADVAFRAAPVEEALGELLPADVAVVNPPRAGLSREAAAALADAPLGSIAYVSCDPATLARDLERLGGRWEVASLRAFDAFPQTSHVETVVWLEGRGA